MKVENYSAGYDSNWNWGYHQVSGNISAKAYKRILKEAKEDYLSGFGIDWSKYDEGVAIFHEMTTCQVEFTNKETGLQIHLSHVWFDDKTGKITQAGTQYGSLTL